MRTIDEWLDEYAESHRNPVNKTIHRIAVPVIAVDMLGLARVVPTEWLLGPSAPNAASLMALVTLAYYFRLSPPLAVGMAVIAAVSIAFLAEMHAALGAAFAPVLVAIFVLAWIAQFYGHSVEGKKPSFFRDMQFLLIGPLWLLADAYRRMGLRYQPHAAG